MLILKKKFIPGVCAVVVFLVAFRYASVDDLIDKMEEYLSYYTPEKVYIHHDKPYYSAGDTIWMAAYLTHGISHMATAPSKLVYVELVQADGTVLIKRDILAEGGTGAADIALPDTLASGTYVLRGYTSFMRNFDNAFLFTRQLRIENPVSPSFDTANPPASGKEARAESASNFSDLVRLSFFPEGGELVNGLWSTVAFKATGPDGKSVDIEGQVTDSKGSKIADIKTATMGMGKFLMQPVEGESYVATLRFGSQKMQLPLPRAKKAGYVMTMTNVSPKFITLKVEAAGGESTDGGTVVGHVRGVVFLTLPATNGQPLQGLIPKEDLPEGVAQFTFFDKQGRPRAERLVFIDQSASRPAAQVNGLQPSYSKRSRVSIDVGVGEDKASSLSVAVVDKTKVLFDYSHDDIVSYLLLSSDIRGEIENPGYYFDEANKDRSEALDNLMMTQGWRRFTWQDIIDDKKPDINFLVEPGFSIAGRVTDFYFQSKPVKTKVTMTGTESDGDIWSSDTESDEDGYFLFTALEIDDTAKVVIQTPNDKKMDRKGKKKEFVEGGLVNLATKIAITEPTYPELSLNIASAEQQNSARAIAAYLEEARRVREIEAAFGGQDVMILDEIEVESRRIQSGERFNKPGLTYGRPMRRIDADSLSKTTQFLSIFEMFIGRTPGVRVVGTYPNYNMIVRGAASLMGGSIYPLYLLNGSIVDVSVINTIPVNRVDFIDILRGTGATLYGTQGAGGVVAVWLKDGDQIADDYIPKGVTGLTHAGYYHAREFYSPDYSTKKESHVRTDVRPTLYWKAGLKAAPGEPARLEFYTSDVASTFEIRIEGITEDGRPFVKVEEFKVN